MRPTSFKRGLLVPMVAMLTAIACGTQSTPSAGSVKVLGTWSVEDQATFMAVLAPFQRQTGIRVSYESTQDEDAALLSRAGTAGAPDVALAPSIGVLTNLAKQGKVIALNDAVNMTALQNSYAKTWIDLGQPLNDGKLYQVFTGASMKGLIWYNPKNFQAKAYSLPNSWDSLISLQATIRTGGATPWCIALESGPATGRPGGDWLTEIVLSQSGPDVYDKWTAGTLKWSSPEITSAFQAWATILGPNNSNVNGGRPAMLSTSVNDGGAPMFTNPPKCYMHNQASFITKNFTQANSSIKPVTDFNFFPLPDINRNFAGVHVVTADAWSMFHDTPQARKLINYLTTAEAQTVWIKRGGSISPNKQTSIDAYPEVISKEAAQLLVNSRTVRYQAIDNMPPDMKTAALKAVLDYTADQNALAKILASLDKVQAAAYK